MGAVSLGVTNLIKKQWMIFKLLEQTSTVLHHTHIDWCSQIKNLKIRMKKYKGTL